MAQTARSRRGKGMTDMDMPFQRMLVVIDGAEVADGAFDMVAALVGEHGTDVSFVQVTEERRQRHRVLDGDIDQASVPLGNQIAISGPTFGARNRQLVHGIIEAAQAFEADVIVLGFERSRLAGHRLAPSLRELITRATDLPVLVTPARRESRRRHRLVPELHRHEEGARPARRYAHV